MRLRLLRGQVFRLLANRCGRVCAFRQSLIGARSVALTVLLVALAVCPARASDSIQQAGDILQLALPGVAAGTILGLNDWEGGVEFAESAALTMGTTEVLKYSVNERRPNGGSQSFPSGHTSISFSAAEFLRKRYGWGYGLPAYAAASFVAYSRVESGEHHPRDVIAGASIGIVSSFIFARPYKGWWIEADTDGRYFGMRFTRKF